MCYHTPAKATQVESFAQAGEELVALLSNSQVLCAPLETLDWHTILPHVEAVKSVAAATDGPEGIP